MMDTSKEGEMWCHLSSTLSQELGGQLFELITTPPSQEIPPLTVMSQDWIGDTPVLDEEDTRDVAYQANIPASPPVPVSQLGPPTRGNFAGPYNFEVRVNSDDTHKKKYLYSHILNRIYVDIRVNFPMQFLWDWEAAGQPLLVRATTVFSDESQAEKRVDRCLQHVHPSNNVGLGDDVCRHVLQSTRQPNTEGVFYTGDHNNPLSWYSVAVQYPTCPDAGATQFTHAYSFQCKSSCNSGINRRSIEIIFTLEELSGIVHGRQAVGVRICSCPRRDLKKDEESAPLRKRKVQTGGGGGGGGAHQGKRVKREPAAEESTAVYTLPPVVGLDTYKLCLTVGLASMKAKLLDCSQEEEANINEQIVKYERALGDLGRASRREGQGGVSPQAKRGGAGRGR